MMGRRSDFPRIDKDHYRTFDRRAGAALASYLGNIKTYCEPCVGAFDLCDQLGDMGLTCVAEYDIDPKFTGFSTDALSLQKQDLNKADAIITNPPWSRTILHDMIAHFASLAPTWLLFDAPWAFTKQSAPFKELCTDIVPVGRLIWIEGTAMSGKDDCAWYRFDAQKQQDTVFHWRAAA